VFFLIAIRFTAKQDEFVVVNGLICLAPCLLMAFIAAPFGSDMKLPSCFASD
jgi:hypothetical protein